MQVSSPDLTLLVTPLAGEWLNASTWPFDMRMLDYFPATDGEASASGLVPVTSKHGADIIVRDFVRWNIDHDQMGVGGDTSWGRMVHEEYRIKPVATTYSFSILPTLNQ